jgi:hypothetical protein
VIGFDVWAVEAEVAELFTEIDGRDENEELDDRDDENEELDDRPPKLPPLASANDDNRNNTTKMQLVINVVSFFMFTSICNN